MIMDSSSEAPNVGKLLQRLGVPASGGTEGTELGGVASTQIASPLFDARTRIEAAEQVLKPRAQADGNIDIELVEKLIKDAEAALMRLENEGVGAKFSEPELWAIEAVIEVDGSRPVLFVQDNTIDLCSPDLTDGLGRHWLGAASDFLDGISKVVASVGGVQLPAFDNKRIGTAFAIAPGLVVTNRHVLEEIARFEDGRWTWRHDAEVDFAGEYERDTTRKFRLHEVVLTGPNPINRRIDYNNLDLAVISVRDGGGEFPNPLAIDRAIDRSRVAVDRKPAVYVVGFPAEPWIAVDDIMGKAPRAGHEYQSVLERIFKNRFGSKRWSPGTIEAGPGQVAGDPRSWIMIHDACTLGGNSGSCVVDFSSNGCNVVGLHFGGRPRIENYAHAVAALQDELRDIAGIDWK